MGIQEKDIPALCQAMEIGISEAAQVCTIRQVVSAFCRFVRAPEGEIFCLHTSEDCNCSLINNSLVHDDVSTIQLRAWQAQATHNSAAPMLGN